MAREMKDSGVEWIGEIPARWKIEKAKHIFTLRNTKGNMVEVLLSPTQKYGVVPQNQLESVVQVREDTNLQTFKTIHCGDFVISLRSFQGGFEYSRYEGVCSPAYQVFYATVPIVDDYYRFLFKCHGFISRINNLTVGIREGKNIQYVDFANSLIPVPPQKEQSEIASFLDQQCAEIDTLLEKIRASIEEYKKLKQAIITQAVTKGVRGDRPMKDSGIGWVGEIPRGWRISRIKYVSKFNPHYNCNNLSSGCAVTYTPMEYIKDGYYIQNIVPYSTLVSSLTVYTEGDIVIAKVTPCFENGNIAIMNNLSSGFGFGSSELFVIKPSEIIKEYLFYWLQNKLFIERACATMTGTGGLKRVSPYFMKNCEIHLPKADEQTEIVAQLNQKCKEIATIIQKKEELLRCLESYRKSLIYEYITGKKEVPPEQHTQTIITYPYFPAIIKAKSPRFAQAVLMSRVLDKCRTKMGRVKLEKMMFILENSIGFNFDTEYVREAAGPLDKSIYACERIISQKNKWFTISKSQYGVSYKPARDISKYQKYYEQYFGDYDNAIMQIIEVFRNFNADQSEIIATLYGAWNDFIIGKCNFTDDDIVNEVLEKWHPKKKRFPREIWLRAIQRMRELEIVPHGYGRLTAIKEQNDGHHRKTL